MLIYNQTQYDLHSAISLGGYAGERVRNTVKMIAKQNSRTGVRAL